MSHYRDPTMGRCARYPTGGFDACRSRAGGGSPALRHHRRALAPAAAPTISGLRRSATGAPRCAPAEIQNGGCVWTGLSEEVVLVRCNVTSSHQGGKCSQECEGCPGDRAFLVPEKKKKKKSEKLRLLNCKSQMFEILKHSAIFQGLKVPKRF